MINVTWTPPVVPNGIFYQYIVQRVNSSGKFYHYVPANQHSISLSSFDDALVFVAVVNLYGQSEYKRAESQGRQYITIIYSNTSKLIIEICLPSPCINGGTCTIRNGTFLCNCMEFFAGAYCEEILKVS